MPGPQTVYGSSTSILITGASSGIGAALATHLGRYGGKLALTARRVELLEEVAGAVRAAGATALALPGDVTDLASVREVQAQVVAAHGPIDVAFLNAGYGSPTSLTGFSADEVKRMFEVNVFGVTNWLEALLPDMISRGRGLIAVTSSLAAARGIPGGASYGATKAAISTFCEGLRVQAKRHGITLVVVEPGFVRTPINDQQKSPLPFLVEPEEAARQIAEGAAAGRPFVRFPWQLAAAVQVFKHLPAGLFDRVSARFAGKRPG